MANLKITLDGQPLVLKAIVVQEGQPTRIKLSPMTAIALTGEPKPINVYTRTPTPLTVRPILSQQPRVERVNKNFWGNSGTLLPVFEQFRSNSGAIAKSRLEPYAIIIGATPPLK
jgi:hypothetical protein